MARAAEVHSMAGTLHRIYQSCLVLCVVAWPLVPADEGGRTDLNVKKQGSFYIGGRVDNLIVPPHAQRTGRNKIEHITTQQMYVQYQIPMARMKIPIVMIHGGVMSGQVYEETPDGRMGWKDYFVRSGYPVYVVDQVSRGRSGFDVAMLRASDAPFVMTHELAWTHFRIGPKGGVPFPDTQFPVIATGQFFKSLIPDLNSAFPADNPNYSALAMLAKRIGGAVLLGHSQSFMYPQHTALIDPHSIRGMISLESMNACNATFTIAQIKTLASIPLLVIFADHISDSFAAPQWTAALNRCREFVTSVQREGGSATFLHLPNVGIRGNTHMLMIDKNNLVIAGILKDWVKRDVEVRLSQSH